MVEEEKTIDAKILLDNPYKTLVELIISEPNSDKLESSIPKGTIVNNAVLNGDMLELDLSEEFIINQTEDEEKINNSIYAIVNTLTELNEVKSIKILINGEENREFNNVNISLKNAFEKAE